MHLAVLIVHHYFIIFLSSSTIHQSLWSMLTYRKLYYMSHRKAKETQQNIIAWLVFCIFEWRIFFLFLLQVSIHFGRFYLGVNEPHGTEHFRVERGVMIYLYNPIHSQMCLTCIFGNICFPA